MSTRKVSRPPKKRAAKPTPEPTPAAAPAGAAELEAPGMFQTVNEGDPVTYRVYDPNPLLAGTQTGILKKKPRNRAGEYLIESKEDAAQGREPSVRAWILETLVTGPTAPGAEDHGMQLDTTPAPPPSQFEEEDEGNAAVPVGAVYLGPPTNQVNEILLVDIFGESARGAAHVNTGKENLYCFASRDPKQASAAIERSPHSAHFSELRKLSKPEAAAAVKASIGGALPVLRPLKTADAA